MPDKGKSLLIYPTSFVLTCFYGYVPDRGISILFLILFSVSTLIHTGQAVFSHAWWLLATAVLCGFLEILGWSARLWSSSNPDLPDPYEMQLTCTILAPTPLLAVNFVIPEKLIKRLGTGYSRLSPRAYIMLFCSCDVISLVIQAIGGGLAATAVSENTNPEKGGHIMLGGIAFQLAYSRTRHTRGHLNVKLILLIAALAFSTICLFIRAVYRTIELSDGWTGRIITTQVYFNVLDGMMVVLALYTFNVFHPLLLLEDKTKTMEQKQEKDADGESVE
ncbi:RTA1 like protein-domain-containing protein [Desarmillaria tabescens]|uniref:RTA1 like protein-domain-containing protein n=1 Tax=Armillaria tabescens TaxID=1929756 RepID=A0AA39TYP1_ARMTA|nr:RTA1 like protein-domain-containing protein [Desarmillaria tabescens]KAK0470203.1 RTA1 like protein-domain-containing protein [Desarmillaria tabescens]